MPKPPLPPEIDEFLKEPNPSVIATLQSGGSPNTVATWYVWENGRVLVNMDEGRKRLEFIRRDPRVSLTVLGKDSWYHQVSLRGESSRSRRTPTCPTSTASRVTTPVSRTPTATGGATAPGSRWRPGGAGR
jgi:hypothetical protein